MAAEFASLKGQLLIASASLVDPNFHRTVVLVTEHNPDGAMGVVLNRPSPVALASWWRVPCASSAIHGVRGLRARPRVVPDIGSDCLRRSRAQSSGDRRPAPV